MGRLVNLPGLGGTPARLHAPALRPVLIPDRSPKIKGLVPFIAEGDKVRRLQFTGRRHVFHFGGTSFSAGSTVRHRVKSAALPFWGLVSEVQWLSSSLGGNVVTLPIYSRDPGTDDIPLVSSGSDVPMGEFRQDSVSFMPGFTIGANGAWQRVPFGFLLPGVGVHVGFHLHNATAGSLSFGGTILVDEVIPAV